MLLALLCALSWTRGKGEDEQCEPNGPAGHGQEFNVQRAALFTLAAICMMMAYAIFALWKTLRRMDERLETETARAVQPLMNANVVDRMLHAENNVMELQVQVNESLRDIDTLYRTLRRRARPHPDEPSSSRPRTTDSRPAQPEPDDGHQPDDTMS